MDDGLTRDEYDALTAAAETYRAALVVRLAGEAGLRTGEITRVRPADLRESSTAGASLLTVPRPKGAADGTASAEEPAAREAVVPAGLAAALRRFADGEVLEPDEPFVDVSPRRVQMLVKETAERAAERTGRPALAGTTPRDLRQFFARTLLDRGVDAQAVREAGGWETLGALDRHLDPLAGEELAAAVGGGRETWTGESAESAESADRRESPPPDPWLADALTAVVAADDRESLFADVTDRLAAASRWDAAWVVGRSGVSPEPSVAAAAGVDPEIASRARFGGEGEGGSEDAAVAAPESLDGPTSGEVSLSEAGASGGSRPATGGGDSPSAAAVAVPLAFRDAVYGTLCVASVDREPSAAEAESLAALGRAAGRAATTFRWRDLLHSDAATELEFHVADEAAFLARLTGALDCRVELATTVAVDDALRCYLDVTGAGPQAVANLVETAPGAADLGLVETREDGCAVSVLLSDGSPVHSLTEYGATVRAATAEGGRVRVVADVPDGTDVRPVAEGLRASFPGARLASKESVARAPHTASALREDVTERFTDRQRAALEAAYHGGYFDWPRGSTAEEVADAMGVSSPTFHNHLRKAQRALLDAVFEDDERDRSR